MRNSVRPKQNCPAAAFPAMTVRMPVTSAARKHATKWTNATVNTMLTLVLPDMLDGRSSELRLSHLLAYNLHFSYNDVQYNFL